MQLSQMEETEFFLHIQQFNLDAVMHFQTPSVIREMTDMEEIYI